VTEAEVDTDNMRLSTLGEQSTLHVEMNLEALLLTGTCVDIAATKQEEFYPRGTQLTLGSTSHPEAQGTLVMSNLGYLQLKSAPGVIFFRYMMLQSGCVECLRASSECTTAYAWLPMRL
jgi:UDP-glucose:glycoprotein glucosyltransferase